MSDLATSCEKEDIPDKVEVKPHQVHNDPKDDIFIISKDQIKFRASRFHLTRTSQFFDGLLGTPRPKGENFTDNDEPIHLDYYSSTISLFLDLTSVCDPYIPVISVTQAKHLLKLTDFAICDSLIDKARATLMEAAKDVPFELLVIASERNDVDMARIALKKIDTSEYREKFTPNSSTILTDEDMKTIKQYLRRLTPSYHLALLDAVMTTGEVREGRYTSLRPGVFFTNDWRQIADKFDPTQFS